MSIGAPLLLYLPTLEIPRLSESYAHLIPSRVDRFRLDWLWTPEDHYYRPATRWLEALFYVICGRRVVLPLEHALSLAIHLGCVALVFTWVRRQTGQAEAAMLAALTLGLHPSITPVPIFDDVRWSEWVVLLFLALAHGCRSALAREEAGGASRLMRFAPALLLLALLAETGAVGVGILGSYVLATAVGRRGRGWLVTAALPFAGVALTYASLRAIAQGNAVRPYVDVEFSGWSDRLGTYAANFLYDLSVLLSPLRMGALAVSADQTQRLAWTIAVLAAVAMAVLLLPRVRSFLAENALPVLGLGLFWLFQTQALWLVRKEPIAVAGITRGHAYYLPVALLALLVGSMQGQLLESGWGSIRTLARCAGAALALASALFTHRSIELWREGGRLLDRDQAVVESFLRGLPAESSILTYGFPDALRIPYLPWVPVYYYAKTEILSAWAGKPLRVYWNHSDSSPPEGFRGWVIETVDGWPHWRAYDTAVAIADYAYRQSRPPAPEDVPVLEELPMPHLLHGLRATSQDDGVLTFELQTDDSSLTFPVSVKPIDHGVFRFELRGRGPALAIASESTSASSPTNARGPAMASAKLYFRAEGQAFDEFRSMAVPVRADGSWEELRFPLFEHPAWIESEKAVELRLDLCDRKGVVEVRGARFENDYRWARRLHRRFAASAKTER